jgi:hypothetical protein
LDKVGNIRTKESTGKLKSNLLRLEEVHAMVHTVTDWTLVGEVGLTASAWAQVVCIGLHWSILGGENEAQSQIVLLGLSCSLWIKPVPLECTQI